MFDGGHVDQQEGMGMVSRKQTQMGSVGVRFDDWLVGAEVRWYDHQSKFGN